MAAVAVVVGRRRLTIFKSKKPAVPLAKCGGDNPQKEQVSSGTLLAVPPELNSASHFSVCVPIICKMYEHKYVTVGRSLPSLAGARFELMMALNVASVCPQRA